MTHFLQRSALVLLATSALCTGPALARTTHHAKKPAAAEADQAERVSYTVKKGDTLATIADKLDTTIDELAKDNNLTKTSVLRPGRVLKGPEIAKAAPAKAGGSKASKAAAAKTYTVKHGDTLFSISQHQHVSIDDLRAANGLSKKGQIHAGQELKLSGADGADEALSKAEAAPKSSAKGRKGKLTPAEVAEAAAGPSDRAAAGRVVTNQASGETYKAKKGDTLAKIAGRLGTSVAELKRLNHVKGNSVTAGKVYRGPSFAEHVYTAVPGDTLASIAQRFGVSVASLRAENEFSKHVVSARPGQKIYLPDGYRDRNAPAEEHFARAYPPPYRPSRGDAQLPSRPQPYIPSPGVVAPSAQPAAPSTPAFTDAQISQMGSGRFQWPLRGTVLSDFGPGTGGQHNDGVNIQAGAGSPVQAAADGEVAYAGDQVPGFGNLVLIKHADGWVTAYGFLSHIDVKNKQKITQGQQIGQAGSTGGVSEPQLHFEVRYAPNPAERARPVDPKLVLPK